MPPANHDIVAATSEDHAARRCDAHGEGKGCEDARHFNVLSSMTKQAYKLGSTGLHGGSVRIRPTNIPIDVYTRTPSLYIINNSLQIQNKGVGLNKTIRM